MRRNFISRLSAENQAIKFCSQVVDARYYEAFIIELKE